MDKKVKEQIRLLKEHLCDDLDTDACKELINELKASPECRIYFDTVKKTVVLCREKECPEDLPEDINQRLFEALDLKEYKDLRE